MIRVSHVADARLGIRDRKLLFTQSQTVEQTRLSGRVRLVFVSLAHADGNTNCEISVLI